MSTILLRKTTAAQNEVALSYHKVRGLYFLAVVFEATVIHMIRGITLPVFVIILKTDGSTQRDIEGGR